jgi:signal peptidase II
MKQSIRNSLFFILVSLIILIDRVTKDYMIKESCFFLFCIKPSINFGASFGLFSGLTLLLIIIAVIVLLLILYFYFIANKKINNLVTIALILLFAGTLSNLIDRILFGYILDWLTFSFMSFPAFNLADVSNIIGALLLVIFLFQKKNKI